MMTSKMISFRKTILWTIALVIGFTLQACSSDDDYPTVDGKNPTIELATTHIQTEPGRAFTIEGTATDADGLKAIRLECEGMDLDKTIDFLEYYPDTLLHDYALSYNYTAKESWKDGDSYPVKVTVEDVLGNTVETTVTVTPDGDFTAPTFTTAPSKALTVLLQNPKLTLNATAADNKSLKYIKVSIPDLSITDSIAISGTSYTFNKVYQLPGKEASYDMTLTVGDNGGNTNVTSSKITVSDMPDFAKMYLADVSEAEDLNSDLFGVPMLISHTGKYQYEAHYYNKVAGTEVRFIPQKTDFEPICFGVDESTGLLTSNPASAKPIRLNKVGYYKITFNSVTGDYNVSTYTPTDETFPQGQTMYLDGPGSEKSTYKLSLAGEGLPGAGNWSTSNPFLLTQDSKNPYLFYGEMTLKKDTKISFTITPQHAWGWWPEPFYRFESGENDSKENEYNTKSNGNNMTAVTVKTDGRYRFEFDTHLLRSRFYLIK